MQFDRVIHVITCGEEGGLSLIITFSQASEREQLLEDDEDGLWMMLLIQPPINLLPMKTFDEQKNGFIFKA